MEKEKLSTAILYAEYVPTVCFSENRPQIFAWDTLYLLSPVKCVDYLIKHGHL